MSSVKTDKEGRSKNISCNVSESFGILKVLILKQSQIKEMFLRVEKN